MERATGHHQHIATAEEEEARRGHPPHEVPFGKAADVALLRRREPRRLAVLPRPAGDKHL